MQPPHCFDRLAGLLHAQRTQVPRTANCQFFALVEAIHHVRILDPQTSWLAVQRTSQLKHAIAATFQSDPVLETSFCNVDLFLERIGTGMDDARDLDNHLAMECDNHVNKNETLLLKYFGMLAQSDSQLNSVLPDFLWGGLDTLRLASKFLDRRIFIASKPTFDFDGPLHLLTIQPDVGVGTSVIKIPEWREWLVGLNDEFDQGRFPLVLALEVEHYSSVLMSAPINVDQVVMEDQGPVHFDRRFTFLPDELGLPELEPVEVSEGPLCFSISSSSLPHQSD